MRLTIHIFILTVLFNGIAVKLSAQCSGGIQNYPYIQNFESGQAGWTSGGTANDWAFGTPQKSVISGAASGNNAWISGGLTGNFYSNGEHSYVESPCFDFSSLTYPYISVKVFWETERTYDGSNFQYSTNNGNTWVTVGTQNEPVNCMTQHWYNTSGVVYLNNPAWIFLNQGWTGNIQPNQGNCQGGNGSGSWVEARHCLSELAGKPGVRFRFTFGAGTSCNSFNGFAFDDVTIGNAPPNQPQISFQCNNNIFSFTGTSTNCPEQWSWNFGDPSSGSQNTASGVSVSHQFSTPGSYIVTLTAEGPCNPTGQITTTIQVIEAQTGVITPVSCYGQSNGTASIQSSGSNLSYTWNTVPPQNNPTATGLATGTYSWTVVPANGGCSVNGTAYIPQPTPLSLNVTTTPSYCQQNNGSLTANANGGTSPYHYAYNGTAFAGSQAGNLSAGNYSVTVTDANGCTSNAAGNIQNIGTPITVSTNVTDVTCPGGADGSIQLTVNGGFPGYSYTWNISGQNTSTLTNLSSGNYTINISDQQGCTYSGSIQVQSPPPLNLNPQIIPVSCYGYTNGSIQLNLTGGNGGYSFLWSNNQTTSFVNNIPSGAYTVTITDQSGCTYADSVTVPTPLPLIVQLIAQNGCAPLLSSALSNVTGGNAPYTYNWQPGGQIGSSAVNLTDGWYSLQVTDIKGCAITDSVLVKSVIPPAFSFSASDTVGCESFCTSFTVEISGISTFQYLWMTGDGKNYIDKNFSHCYESAGNYTVSLQVTDNNGCTTTETRPAYITVYPKPTARFSYTYDPYSEGSIEVSFTDLSYSGIVYRTWRFGLKDSSDLELPTYTYGNSGIYEVFLEVVNEYGCVSSLTEDIELKRQSSLYVPTAFTPNGDYTNEVFKVKYRNIKEEGFWLGIYDRWGILIKGITELEGFWDGSGYAQGEYVWRVEYRDWENVQRVEIGRVMLYR